MTEQRYTLALPPEVYDELKAQAEKNRITLKEALRQCLKIGLLVAKIDEDPDADLYVREKVRVSEKDEPVIRETRLRFVR